MLVSAQKSGKSQSKKITPSSQTDSSSEIDEWRTFTTGQVVDRVPEIPVDVWWKVFCWMDHLKDDVEDQLIVFWYKKLLAVRIHDGELQYLPSERPNFWFLIDDLTDL